MPTDALPAVDTTLLDRLLGELDREFEAAVELRERLHRLAEPSHQEHETARVVKAALGASAVSRIDGAGFSARLGASAAPGVVVRAELDALPIAEATGAHFASGNGHMHACGHDVHMAALTALFRAASRLESQLPAPLVALFQPSEEAYPSGARAVAERAYALGEVGAVVAAHLHPDVPWRAVSADAGDVNASADNFTIRVTGVAGHAAYPHDARDPVVALGHIVVGLQHIVSRRVDPMKSAAITVSVLHAGSTENVIPESGEARGTIRAFEPETRAALRAHVVDVAQHMAQACGCQATVSFTEGEPQVVNDPLLSTHIRAALTAASFALADPLRSCGSDDFGYYASIAPSLLAFVGLKGAPGWNDASLHHPAFLPPPEAVSAVARAQAASYLGAAAALGSEDWRSKR